MLSGIATVALGIVIVALAAGVVLGPPALRSHADGDGLLASNGRPVPESMSVDPNRSADAWTFGIRLCTVPPDREVDLRDISARNTLGTGFKYLGARVRTFTQTTTHTPIISVAGFPPPPGFVPDQLDPVNGTAVTAACSNGIGQPYTELLVGMGRVGSGRVGDDGGGWQGILIDYTSGGQQYRLSLDHNLLICGRSDPIC